MCAACFSGVFDNVCEELCRYSDGLSVINQLILEVEETLDVAKIAQALAQTAVSEEQLPSELVSAIWALKPYLQYFELQEQIGTSYYSLLNALAT